MKWDKAPGVNGYPVECKKKCGLAALECLSRFE